MNTAVETINIAGGAFVDFALPMLIQSGASACPMRPSQVAPRLARADGSQPKL
jgi:hypothetical protein